MKIKILLTLCFLLMASFFAKAQKENDYYVYQYRLVKTSDLTDGFQIVDRQCYQSKVTKNISARFVKIKTDRVEFKYFVIQKIIKTQNKIDYYVAIYDRVYFFRELKINDHYYLWISPIKIHKKDKFKGTGLGLIISDDPNVCYFHK